MATKDRRDAEFVDDSVKEPLPAQALVRQEHLPVTLTRNPVDVLKDAKQAADALMAVIAAKKDPIIMNGKQYLVYEDWQTVGRFFNLVPKVREDKLIQIQMGPGKLVTGYEAYADVIDTVTGAVITSANAMCLNDEDKWSARSKFEYQYVLKSGGHSKDDPGFDEIVWEPIPGQFKENGKPKNRPRKVRIQVDDVSVPLFQLRSMAQTRACAKAMRNAMAWVVVLAGFQPTPAEELEEVHHGAAKSEEPEWIPLEEEYYAPNTDAAGAPVHERKATRKRNSTTKATAEAPPPSVDSRTPDPPPPPLPKPNGGKPISDPQRKRLFAFATEYGWSQDQLKVMLEREFKIHSTTEIQHGRDGYDRICDKILPLGPQKWSQGGKNA
jgi:hypothetical protein